MISPVDKPIQAESTVHSRLHVQACVVSQHRRAQVINARPFLVREGVFKLIDKMMGVQGEIFHTPTILLSGAVSGEEEALQ